jgi:hypothetical protein
MLDASDLPPAERAKQYRRLAEDALQEANKGTGAVRESYLIIAEQFKRLATVAEAADHK